MRAEVVAALCLPALLGACATVPAPGTPASPRLVGPAPGLTVPTRPPERMGTRQAIVHMAPGLEDVIGATQPELTRAFGAPRLDVWEGDARKLQFTGEACVLDVYLYPKVRGGEPQATYVEARRDSGADTDRAGCVAALRQPPAGTRHATPPTRTP